MTAVPTTVVFDVGGVLVDWDPRHLYRSLFPGDEPAMERFLAEICSPDWNAQQDAGRPFAQAIEELVGRHPEFRDEIEAYWLRWAETLGEPLHDSVELVDELRRAGVRLLALTNWSAETYPTGRRRYPFLDWFEAIVVSGEERIAKPDPRIFRLLLDRFGLEAESTVFIDDSEANVRAAADVGMIAIRFEGAAELRERLIALGVLATQPAPVAQESG
jgi:2-haloacid dehalogenase